jgi:hypothetical protein
MYSRSEVGQNPSMSQEVVIAGELSPREHIDRIRAALENARNAIFDVAILITDTKIFV